MLTLPKELFIYKVSKYLQDEDISNLQNTHSNLNKIFIPDSFWQNRLIEKYPEMVEGKPDTFSFRNYLKHIKLGIIRRLIDKHNTINWYLNGQLHRDNGPARQFATGTKQWWVNNQLHREDGPAIEKVNGTKEWWVNHQLHREDGPAIEEANGSKYWYLNGYPHREDDWLCQLTQL